MAKQPQQFDPILENIRKELDAKAEYIRRELDTKIESKVSNHVFYWVFGVLLTLLITVLGFIVNSIKTIDDKQHKTVERLVRVEMKCNNADSINERLVRLETQIKSK